MPRICNNCFRNIPDGNTCPYCGYNPDMDAGKYRIALRPGTVLAGRYYIGRVLGQGGFGITYVALDTQTRSRVALKEYLPTEFVFRGMDTVSLEMNSSDAEEGFEYGKRQFLDEARTLASFVGNEYIVSIHSYFEENGTAYFAMEYMDGLNLKQYMEHKGRLLEVWEANRILLPIMEALDWVHSKGIIHRDISPDNIMIKRDGNAKLIDFGAARYSTGEKSKSLDVVLKHGFAPVEQYSRRGRQGPFTDVYSMAATYYYAITGKVPPDSIDRLGEDELKKPSEFGVRIRKETEAVLMKALSVQASERYQKMSEFYTAMMATMPRPFFPEEDQEEKAHTVQKPAQKPAAIRPAAATVPAKRSSMIPFVIAALILALVVGVLAFTTDILPFRKQLGEKPEEADTQLKQEESVPTEEPANESASTPSPTAMPKPTVTPAPSASPSSASSSEELDTASIRKDSWVNILSSRITGKHPDGSIDAEIEVEYNLAGEDQAQLCLMGYFYEEDNYWYLEGSNHIINPGKGEYTFHALIPSTDWDPRLSVYIHPYPIPDTSWLPLAENYDISLQEVKAENTSGTGIPTAEKPAAEQTVLTLWCIATESDANRPAYEKAIAEFEENHPNIRIELEAFENQSYKTKIRAAMSDPETLPDIFFTWSGSFLGDFAQAGAAYCVDEAYKPFADQLPEVMLQNSTYDGHHYAVPLTMNTVVLFANMNLLAKAGWNKVPETYEELTACCDALLKKGITPFGCAGKEIWCITEYLEPIIENTIGYEAMSEIFSGKASWNNPGIADAVDTLQNMISKGYFDPNGTALSNDEVKQNFISGKTAFYQNGSWNCGEINDKVANAQVALFPVINTEKASYGQLIGGPSESLAVSAYCKDPDMAAAAAFEIGRSICRYGYLAGSGLPAWTPDYDTNGVKPLIDAVANIVASAEGMVLFGDTAMSADPANIYLDYVALVYGGEIDGAGFVEGLTNDLG